ncbi:hypothetical protein AW736_01690 [Termitidicoccus mucosus]|uniref:Uncharacterized protein n=2 Tax=Termitidicoccus mucosus TaxID=1184151 RepID=A0A178IPF7_9BACT|nr:hypothetical protein AW736_01690 [Opitutaceae bacterium TSB47]
MVLEKLTSTSWLHLTKLMLGGLEPIEMQFAKLPGKPAGALWAKSFKTSPALLFKSLDLHKLFGYPTLSGQAGNTGKKNLWLFTDKQNTFVAIDEGLIARGHFNVCTLAPSLPDGIAAIRQLLRAAIDKTNPALAPSTPPLRIS